MLVRKKPAVSSGAKRIPKEEVVPPVRGARRLPKEEPVVKSSGARRIPKAPAPPTGGARRVPKEPVVSSGARRIPKTEPVRAGGARRVPKAPEPEVADLEKALLTKACESRDWTEIARNKISPKHFANFDNRLVFSFLQEQHKLHGEIPSVGVLRTEFPEWVPETTSSSQKILIERLRDRKIYADLHKVVQEVITEAREDPKKGLDKLRTASVTLTTENLVDNEINVSEDMSGVLDRYRKAKKTKGLRGIPWPWKSLTELTGGIEPGEFITFFGAPGVMKTWVLLYIIQSCLLFGKTAVLFTFEMTKEEIADRYAAMLAKVDWSRFRGGCMTEEEEARLESVVRDGGGTPPFIIVELEENGAAARAAIRAKIKEHKADIAFIDGLSFITDELKWDVFGDAVKDLRNMSRSMKVALIATHHSNRQRKSTDKKSNDATDIALGDTLQRYCTQIYRLTRSVSDEEKDQLVVGMPKQRESKRKIMTIHARPAFDFGEKYFDAIEADELTGDETL